MKNETNTLERPQLKSQLVEELESELKLGYEVAGMQSHIQEKAGRVRQVEQSFSFLEQMGLARKSLNFKKSQIKKIQNEIEQENKRIESKFSKWKTHQAKIEEALDFYLETYDSDYRSIKKNEHKYNGFKKVIHSLTKDLEHFTQKLGEMRNVLPIAYKWKSTNPYSEAALSIIDKTAVITVKINQQMTHINEQIDDFNCKIKGMNAYIAKLPALNIDNFAQTTKKLPIDQALFLVETLIGESKNIESRHLPELYQLIEDYALSDRAKTQLHVNNYWDKIRQDVWQHMQS